MAWKRVSNRCVPHIASHNMGNIIYIHYRKSDFKNHDPSNLIFCTNTTTSFDCCIHHRDDRATAHSNTIIGINLKCECWTTLGYNFHHALSEMESITYEIEAHINGDHARFFI